MQLSKYNASGNDFVIFHTFAKKDYSALAKKLCHRQRGVGADGLIVLVPNAECDFEWLFYNSDGSEASMCGNGSRACAHFAFTNGLAPAKMGFLTKAGKISSFVDGNMVESQLTGVEKLKEAFEEEGRVWHFYDTGVPHLVSIVANLEEFDKSLAQKMRYKYNANVNFMLLGEDALHVRTYERGVEDETGACGTGVAACFYTANTLGLVAKESLVLPTSGEKLYLRLEDEKLFFKGEVQRVFEVAMDVH